LKHNQFYIFSLGQRNCLSIYHKTPVLFVPDAVVFVLKWNKCPLSTTITWSTTKWTYFEYILVIDLLDIHVFVTFAQHFTQQSYSKRKSCTIVLLFFRSLYCLSLSVVNLRLLISPLVCSNFSDIRHYGINISFWFVEAQAFVPLCFAYVFIVFVCIQ
jgi:hypothetical protein